MTEFENLELLNLARTPINPKPGAQVAPGSTKYPT